MADFSVNKVYKLQYKDGGEWKDVKLGVTSGTQIIELLSALNFKLEDNNLVITYKTDGQNSEDSE